MRVHLQRVNHACVVVKGETVGKIDRGLLLLVGFGVEDTEEGLQPMAHKIAHLRVFPDERGRFHFSVKDVQGGVLLVPQFTLFADMKRGRRPDFISALEPAKASPFFDQFVELFREIPEISQVATGIFGADMKVSLENDGPVTLLLESNAI